MVGPKLDARAYTTLLLAVIAVLLTVNIVAQSSVDRSAQSTPAATLEVAAATREVARSNEQVARSLSDIATAIRGLKFEVNVPPPMAAAPAATGGTDIGGAPAAGDAPARGRGNEEIIFDMGGARR
ncbi:MAG: hypothetical protein SF028_02550 [Candidatus Sumerlaeia bacterium]|nr:hypothetical protein [Candidatus Sumerlaeia bacterium]